jgi:hypothetical protein
MSFSFASHDDHRVPMSLTLTTGDAKGNHPDVYTQVQAFCPSRTMTTLTSGKRA